jgi:hypothetical protein
VENDEMDVEEILIELMIVDYQNQSMLKLNQMELYFD